MDPYVYLMIVSGIVAVIGGFVAFMARRQRLEEEAGEANDIPAE